MHKRSSIIPIIIALVCLTTWACTSGMAPVKQGPIGAEEIWLLQDKQAADVWEDSLLQEEYLWYPYHNRQQMRPLPQVSERHQLPYPEPLLIQLDDGLFLTDSAINR